MLARLRAGDAEPYLAHAARRGRLAVEENPTTAKERLLHDWWREARRNPTASVMLAYRRADVDELNRAAHALMLRDCRLDDRSVTLGNREYRVGDKVLCRKNDNHLGLRNGMRGTVVGLEDDELTVRDARTARRVPFEYAAEHLHYGYALTGHAAQGITVDRAFVLFPDHGALREWGYVACTRARLETRVYLAGTDALDRETPLREPEPAAPAERASRALQRPAAEAVAVKQRERPHDSIFSLVSEQQAQLDRQQRRTSELLTVAQCEVARLR